MKQNRESDWIKSHKGHLDSVCLEGFHALKHAIRFEAKIEVMYRKEDPGYRSITSSATDEKVVRHIEKESHILTNEEFKNLAPQAQYTGVCAKAEKRTVTYAEIEKISGIIVFLENPRTYDNIGAVIRVCAARGVGALIMTGDLSPWHARAIRSAAGLQWSLPVLQVKEEEIKTLQKSRPFYACTDEGQSVYEANLETSAVYVFGTERDGISKKIREQANKKIALPMQEGVSSMNLATAVSGILYHKPKT